jgi:NADH-quinone oxidoreductase subunit J
MMHLIAFYVIAAVILTGALLSVTSRKIFRSAIWLLFSLIGIAAFYFWIDMQFLAAVQIVVYIGGIVVLIIFSIFLTQQTGTNLPPAIASHKIGGTILCLAGFLMFLWIFRQTIFNSTPILPGDVSVNIIGRAMLSTGLGGYALPFELVSVLLLAAMIGCIVIAIKKSEAR